MNKLIKEAKEIFIKYLKSKNLKITKERLLMVKIVFQNTHHFDAEEIYFLVKKRKFPISRATIYRTLDLLIECNLIQKLNFGENHARYEHIFGHEHHEHLICQRCSSITEFHNKELEDLKQEICKKHNFIEVEHNLRIFGICTECQV